MKNFTSTRDKAVKVRQDEHDKNEKEIFTLDKEIGDLSWKKDQEERKLADKDLFKRQLRETTLLEQEFNQT